jgi:hypothetical protein
MVLPLANWLKAIRCEKGAFSLAERKLNKLFQTFRSKSSFEKD